MPKLPKHLHPIERPLKGKGQHSVKSLKLHPAGEPLK